MELFNRSPTLGFRLLVLVLLSITLMIIDHASLYLNKLQGLFGVVVNPIHTLVDKPIAFAKAFQTKLSSHQTLLDENAQLKAEQLRLKGQVQKLLSLEGENQRLRALLRTSKAHGERVSVARLLAIATNPFVQEYTLAKGRQDGLFIGQSVLDAEGILGQIIRVNKYTSQVLLLTDNRSAIPVENSRTGVRGVVVGSGSTQSLQLQDIPKTENIAVGDTLISSGLGKRYPPGYPVGIVSTVKRDPDEHFARIQVQPSAHFNRGRLVLLVWPKVGSS